MKQALHCGFSSKPTLNQTGELKAAYWRPGSLQLGLEGLGLFLVGEVTALSPRRRSCRRRGRSSA
jgi:hypothetical protein